MRKVNPQKHEARRRQILDAAAKCFSIKGFNDTRTADVCAAAGISSGNLFHYFPSKQAIFTAIFKQDGEDNALALERAIAAADPLEALLEFVGFTINQAAYPHLAGFMLEVIANAKRDAAFAALLDRNDRALREGLILLLEHARKAGQTDPALDPMQAADWIQLLMEGVFVRASCDARFQAASQQAMARRMICRFLGSE